MEIRDQITSAIAAHGALKLRLKTAIENDVANFSLTTVHSEDSCVFGKWLQKKAATRLKTSPHYARCSELHRQFHVVAVKVLTLALSGNKTEAMHAVDLRGELTHVSSALAHAMMEWRGEG